jgi:hypothetical protein
LAASARAAAGPPCRNEQLRDARHRDTFEKIAEKPRNNG